MFNTLGNILKLTTYGESHGHQIGGILDGFPAGIELDINSIQTQLDLRKPGQSDISTQRKESDTINIVSGLFEGKSTGHPIGFYIKNKDQKSKDYSDIKGKFRPSHADMTYFEKYGNRDYRGSGRASARETANWVTAGSIAKHIIPDIEVVSYVSSIGDIFIPQDISDITNNAILSNIARCPDLQTASKMIAAIEEAKEKGDSLGGTISCIIKNVPIGLGEPIFKKLHSQLGMAMLSINACKGIEFGSGFEGTKLYGSEANDEWSTSKTTKTNHSGGIQGGISNGMNITFKLAFKPTSSIKKTQNTIDSDGNKTTIQTEGRHDPCVVPRAIPIVNALANFILADMYLLNKIRKI